MCEGAHYSAAHFHSPGLDGFTPPLLQVLWSTFNPASPDLDEKTKADVLKELPLHTTLEQFIALYRLSLSLSLSLSLYVCVCCVCVYVCVSMHSPTESESESEREREREGEGERERELLPAVSLLPPHLISSKSSSAWA